VPVIQQIFAIVKMVSIRVLIIVNQDNIMALTLAHTIVFIQMHVGSLFTGVIASMFLYVILDLTFVLSHTQLLFISFIIRYIKTW
jgi:hypothetical protein